jgi:hypothetical protein
MTLKEIVPEVERLSQDELLQLLDVIVRTLRASRITALKSSPTDFDAAASLQRVLGMLATDKPAPTDQEVDELRFQYLMEKHA